MGQIAGGRRRVGLVGALAAVLPLALAAACQSSGSAASSNDPASADAKITVTPATGTDHVRPDIPVKVQVANGKIQTVKVTAEKRPKVEGTMGPGNTTWESKWTLSPKTEYTVNVTAVNAKNKAATSTSTFTTMAAKNTFNVISLGPNNKETVGAGMPIMLQFSSPISNKAKVEKALEVKMSKKVEGGWRWVDSSNVIYRPRHYWPKGEKVELYAHLRGVRAAKNMYGTKNFHLKFQIKHKVIVKASTTSHQLRVYQDGKKIRHWPISAGRGGVYKYYTTSGIHLTMDRGNPVRMVSPGISKGQPGYYSELINYAVRISNSGEYIHSMPSTVWAQGHTNVSHGCINSPPADAEWFYKFAKRGDIVIVTGTPRKLEPDNGWGYWQMPWKQWRKGSALH
ncbi:MAG TPA: Ig-like domain-containing protein [Streptosporangiaceae bacterium]